MGLRLKQGREGRSIFCCINKRTAANFPAVRKTKQLFHGCVRIKVATVRFVCVCGGGGGGGGAAGGSKCCCVSKNLIRILFLNCPIPTGIRVGDGLLC